MKEFCLDDSKLDIMRNKFSKGKESTSDGIERLMKAIDKAL